MTGGQYLTVNSPTGTYYNNTSMPAAGSLRYHSGGRIDVCDGNGWMTVAGTAQVSLTPDALSAIDWAIKKCREEQEMEELSKIHPAVKLALDNMRKAEEQLKITMILSKDETTTS